MRVPHRAVRRDHQHPAQLRGVADDPALVHGDAALLEPGHDRCLQPAHYLARADQLVERRDLGPGQLVDLSVGVHEQPEVDVLEVAEVARVGRGSMPDHGHLHVGLLEFVSLRVDLHRHLAAEHTAEVAHEHEHRRPLAPQVAEPDGVALVVVEHHVLEHARVGGRVGLLRVAHRVEHRRGA